MERTLSIIKPDGVKKNIIGEIIKRFETAGLRVAAIKKAHMTKAVAEGFYAVHKGKFFYDELTSFMSEGPVVLMVLEGDDAISLNRKLMGATNLKRQIQEPSAEFEQHPFNFVTVRCSSQQV
jgi:nucleoside-diphosphate kinase